MRVLVTGATGFVAGHLVPHLVEVGHEVFAAGHDPARLARFGGAQTLHVDLASAAFVAALPARLDAIIHLAQANVPFPERAADLFAVNVASTQLLLDYARRAGVGRFVLASSGSVYGGGDRPWRESDAPGGVDCYAATKLAAERLVAAYGGEFPHTIFRPFAPYGPGQARRLVPGLIERVRTGQPVTLREGRGPRFNPIYVDHVADVFAQALAASGQQVLNLGGDEILSVREMADMIGRELGREPRFEDVPGAIGGDSVGDTTQLRAHYRLPTRLISFAAGVRAMLAMKNAQ